jgi:hypothetical protein
VAHDRELALDEAWATYKSAVKETETVLARIDRWRSRTLDEIDDLERKYACIPTWHDSGDEVALLRERISRKWLLVELIDNYASQAIKRLHGPTQQLCDALETRNKKQS